MDKESSEADRKKKTQKISPAQKTSAAGSRTRPPGEHRCGLPQPREETKGQGHDVAREPGYRARRASGHIYRVTHM